MYDGDSGASAWASVAKRGKARLRGTNLQLMLASCLHPIPTFYIFFIINDFLQVCARACPPPQPPLFSHLFISSLRSLPWTLLRRRACGAHCPFLFLFIFLFLFLSPLQVSARACGAPAPPPSFHSHPCYVSSLRSLPWKPARRRACGAYRPFLLLLSLFLFPFPFPFLFLSHFSSRNKP